LQAEILRSNAQDETPRQEHRKGHGLMEIELLCLNESLSESGSPPSIYFNSLFAHDGREDHEGDHEQSQEKKAGGEASS
jgi:hypothetical protein